MKVLIIKTSSLGDVIHTFPALTDAQRILPGIGFDWVVEENFSVIPAWHPAVARVIPIALRRWRKSPLSAVRTGEWKRYRKALRATCYDAVIDAQGLLKSALFSTILARGPRFGLDRNSAREPLATLFYQNRLPVPKDMHAVERIRQLFGQALGYAVPPMTGDYAIAERFPPGVRPRSLLFLHGTTWVEKHWPEEYWCELADLALADGWNIEMPWGNESERQRAHRIAAGRSGIEVLPRLGLEEIALRIASATGIVSVDTGLSHLAAALGRPNIVLFGPTDPGLVGGYGARQVCLRASEMPPVSRKAEPQIFAPLTPALVWAHLLDAINPDTDRKDE